MKEVMWLSWVSIIQMSSSGWVKVDLRTSKSVGGVVMQGRGHHSQHVTSLYVLYSTDDITWSNALVNGASVCFYVSMSLNQFYLIWDQYINLESLDSSWTFYPSVDIFWKHQKWYTSHHHIWWNCISSLHQNQPQDLGWLAILQIWNSWVWYVYIATL